jgi:hypothetical protein
VQPAHRGADARDRPREGSQAPARRVPVAARFARLNFRPFGGVVVGRGRLALIRE